MKSESEPLDGTSTMASVIPTCEAQPVEDDEKTDIGNENISLGEYDTLKFPEKLSPPKYSPSLIDESRLPVEDCDDDYDSDCLVIVESEEIGANTKDDHDVTSTSQSPSSGLVEVVEPQPEGDDTIKAENCEIKSQTHLKLHNLPINELKRKLAFCSVCHTQYQTHKQANLCLSKHGKRQCWLCLDVMVNTKDSYYQHCVRNHAIGQSNDIVGCPYCQKFFDFRQGFNQHIVKVHFSEDISYVSTTACLSPKSLVDIFTGQPRAKQSDRKGQDNETQALNEGTTITTTTTTILTPLGIDNSCPLILPPINSSDGEQLSKHNIGVTEFPIQLQGSNLSDIIFPSINNTSTYSSSCLEDTSPKIELNYKNLGPLQIDFDKEVSNEVEQNEHGMTARESVIRETPQSNLTSTPTRIHGMPEFPLFHSNQHNAILSQQVGRVGSELKQDISGKSHSTLYCRPPSRTSYQQLYFHHFPLNSINPDRQAATQIQSQNLILPPQQRRVSTDTSSNPYPNNRLLTSGYKVPGGLHSQLWPQTISASMEHYHHHGRSHFGQSQTPSHVDRGHGLANSGGCTVAGTSGQQLQQLSPILDPLSGSQQQSSSPCLLEMEKMIHSTSIPVHVQYFNSVNSMLRTVTECNPSAPFSPNLTATSAQETQITPTIVPISNSVSKQVPPSGRHSDSDTFKVPSNAGIKRRILTKWDEHQEIKTRGEGSSGKAFFSSAISPTIPGTTVEFNHLVDQVEIRTDLNPINNINADQSRTDQREDKFFLEQVLKESNSMYKAVNDHIVQLYDDSVGQSYAETLGGHTSTSSGHYSLTNLDQQPEHQQQVRHGVGHFESESGIQNQRISSNTQRNYQNPPYPRIMARVDTHGRPVGVFTADGQPCLMSSYDEPKYLKACDVTETRGSELVASHLQYQHRIIRQVSSEGSRPRHELTYAQPNLSSHNRKRKSIPVRLSPNSESDCVIVQNPFEEEESSSTSRRSHSSQDYFDKIKATPPQVTMPPPRGHISNSGHKFHQFNTKQSHHHNNQRFLSKGGRFINFQPKFTSGGQITDFSGRNPCNTSVGKSVKNFNTVSVATNFGVWNTSNGSVGIGLGLIGSTISSSNSQLQQQIHAGEYYDNDRVQGPSTNSSTTGNWPPFSVCQKYYETTQNIMSRLKDLDKQRKRYP